MADDLYVLNEGETIPTDFTATPSAGTFNIKTSVNPRAVSINVSSSTTLGINCYEIHSDDESTMGSGTVSGSKLNRLFPESTTIDDYANNIIENPGYRVTIDTNLAGVDLENTRDYFIVIYADNVKKHHIAKITEQTTYEDTYKHFEFTPRLKENIITGTKVAIYQGPLKTDNVVAVGYGLLNDIDVSDTVTTSTSPDNIRVSSTDISSSLSVGDTIISSDFSGGTTITAIDGRDITPSTSPTTSASGRSIVFAREERHDKYVDISRPTFYFYEGDKLDHDRKYTLLKVSTNFSGTKKSVFKTAPLSSDMIIDKGFFTHHGDLTDNNRANDNLSNPRDINAQGLQGSTYTFNRETWAGSSKNIYDSDGGLSTYITFIDSPVKNQIHSSPYYVNVNKTVTNKGNMATIKFFDVEKILDKKINTYERFKVKQFITEKKLDRIASSALPGSCTNTTSNTFTVSGLVAGEDWRKVLFDGSSAYEPVFIENYYYVISNITAPANGEQVVTVTHKRLLTANAFSSVGTLETFSAKKAYRKTWSPVSQTFLADHQIDTQIDFANAITRNGITVTTSDSDVNGIEYILEDSKDSVILEVDKGDKDTGYTKITSRPASNFFSSKYLTDSITGKLIVNNPIFEGFVETKKADVKQAFKYEIVGRDSISNLLNTSLDKNYVHSDEFVYTTFNPLVGDATSSTELVLLNASLVASSISGKVIDTSIDPTAKLFYGDTVAFKMNGDRYVVLGVVESTSTDGNSTHKVTLMKDSYISDLTNLGDTTLDSNKLYKVRKSIIPSKNLETTPRITNRASSIVGTLDKGIVFGSGKQFDVTGDTFPLIIGSGTGVENGYDINEFVAPFIIDNVYRDFPIGFNTTLDIPASTPELEILSTQNNPNGTVSYELGYVSPIVLGLVTKNNNDGFVDTRDGVTPVIKNHPIRLINGQGLPDGGFLHLLSSYKNSDKSPKTFNNVFSDDPALTGINAVKSQYAFRYNQPIFRYANMAKIENQLVLQPYAEKYSESFSDRFTVDEFSSSSYSRNDYYENTKNFNFYLSSYKTNKSLFDFDKDNSFKWLMGYPKEQTGIYPALGSRFFDINRVPSWYYISGQFFGNRFGFGVSDLNVGSKLKNYVSKLELHDPSALSLHLFSLGDVYPESKTNHNNIFYSGRNINDYSIIFKRDKTINNENNNDTLDHFTDFHSPLAVSVSSRQDGDYHIEPISSSSGSQTRFNLMRLTDVTFDMLFNEVDYENYKVGDNSTEISKLSTANDTFPGEAPCILVKSFPQAGMHNVDVKVGSAHSDPDKLNVTSTDWYSSAYKYWIYYYSGSNLVPTVVGRVTAASAGVITFSASIDQAVDVTDTVLYVQTHYNNISDSTNTTKMLLTRDSVVPYYPEDGTKVKHNYNKTAIFGNSNMDINNIYDEADDTFNASGVSTKSRILRTPIFKSTIGALELVHTRKTTTLATPDAVSPVKMKVNVNVSGDTITLTDGSSKLTRFFDTHTETKIGTSFAGQVNSLGSFAGLGGGTIDGDGNDILEFSGGSHNLQVGQVIKWGSTSNDYHIITEIPANNQIKVSPAHNSTASLTATSPTFTGVGRGHFTATGKNEFFIEISGLTNAVDNRLYKVIANTNTTLTLRLIGHDGTAIADGSILITPTLATQNGVDITIKGFSPSGNALTFSSGTYNSNWVTSINGVDEPIVYSAFANNVIPHRAYHDSEGKIDYGGLDTIVAQFHDIPQLAQYRGFALLSTDVKNIRGAHSGHELDTAQIIEMDYRFGNHSTNTQRWNKAVCIENATANQGILSENYGFGTNQYSNKIYGGEVFFKPYIKYQTSMNAGDTTDLTNEKTLKFDIAETWGSGTNNWINYCNNLTGYYFYNETDKKLHKIISHEINRLEDDVFRHLIKIDNTSGLGGNEILRLMRINQVCMYDFSPNRININNPKIEYTKVCGEDRMQTTNFDATRYSASDRLTNNNEDEPDGEGLAFDVTEEGVKSMYVIIDPDGFTSDFLETRESTTISDSIASSIPIRMNANDGITSFITSVSKMSSKGLEFSEVKKLLGTPSFGSTFTITVNKSPQFKPETACIAASFKIVDEIESAINDAFTINDITYTQDTVSDKYYGAFNFTGQSLYSAANNLLSYKNKEISVDGEEIKIVDKEDDKKYRNIVLSSKNSDFQITSISNDVSLLDNFDEVIVIGDGVRGIARNPIDTEDTNRTIKTREIYDYSILGQKQADLKASQYLDVFNTANTSIEIEVADNVPFLKPGQIIQLEFQEQNIPRGDYLVIESEKEFGRPTKFILSEYSKDLAGTFSLLMGEIRNLQGFTRQKVYTSTSIPRIKRDKVNIKFVKSTATQGTGSPVTSTIGFGYTIGFNSEIGP